MHCDVPSLWEEYKDRLYSFIRKRVQDPEDAKDILQAVLLKVYRFCQQRSGVTNLSSWLYQIAQNAIMDHYKEKRRTSTPTQMEATIQDSPDVEKEAAAYILPLINLLPEEYAVPLRLSDIENMKQSDIAEKLHLSLTAAKSRIQRARKLLRKEALECLIIEFGKKGDIADFEIKENCMPLQGKKKEKNND